MTMTTTPHQSNMNHDDMEARRAYIKRQQKEFSEELRVLSQIKKSKCPTCEHFLISDSLYGVHTFCCRGDEPKEHSWFTLKCKYYKLK